MKLCHLTEVSWKQMPVERVGQWLPACVWPPEAGAGAPGEPSPHRAPPLLAEVLTAKGDARPSSRSVHVVREVSGVLPDVRNDCFLLCDFYVIIPKGKFYFLKYRQIFYIWAFGCQDIGNCQNVAHLKVHQDPKTL